MSSINEALHELGKYVILNQADRKLRITLTQEGREELLANVSNPCTQCDKLAGSHWIGGPPAFQNHEYQPPKDAINFTRPPDMLLPELLEDHLCNGWSMIDPAQIGALTSAPIIAHHAEFDDDFICVKADAVYWFPNYMIEAELETLLRQGFVEFERAPDQHTADPEDFKCVECGQLFDNQGAAESHDCPKAKGGQ